MTSVKQFSSTQYKTRAVRTELLTGKPCSTDVNRIFSRFKSWTFRLLSSVQDWKIPLEHQTKELNLFQDLSGIHIVGTLLMNLMRKHRRCVNIFWLRTNWDVMSFVQLGKWEYGNDKNKTLTHQSAPFPPPVSKIVSLESVTHIYQISSSAETHARHAHIHGKQSDSHS